MMHDTFCRLDEKKAEEEATEFLQQFTGPSCVNSEDGVHGKRTKASVHAPSKHSSVYISGLRTYMACKQLGLFPFS